MSHIEYIGGKYVLIRRGRIAHPIKATHKVEWVRVIKKSKSGVEHVNYIPTLQKIQ